ncbi:hypothetical protein EOQ13_02670 [Staphylococcus pseudintermedius]|nr:hypothetical protein [Staphylococcus pseudintermedius]
MKDEIKSIKGIHVFQDLVRLIDDYIDYYNNDRFQIGLAKLSPNQFETYIKTGDYPLIQYQNPRRSQYLTIEVKLSLKFSVILNNEFIHFYG